MSTIKNQMWDELSTLIDKSQIIVLSTHINSDGDGLGSEIAFYYYLKNLKKECRIINATPLPENYKIIDPDGAVEAYSDRMNDWLLGVDLSIVFDIGDYKRVGEMGNYIYNRYPSVSIDHHPEKNDTPFELSIVDQDAPATGYLIWKYFQYQKISTNNLQINIANALYASIVTDTGSFKYQSTTSDTHFMAADLIDSGVEGYIIQRYIYEEWKYSSIKLLGKIISRLKFAENSKVAWVVVTQEMVSSVNATIEDVEGVTEFIRGIENIEISFMILESSATSCRINFRSSGNYSVNDIAALFDGGGHKFAAGAKINNNNFIEIENKILNKIQKKMKEICNGD